MTSGGVGCCSWVAQTLALGTVGMGPFGKGLTSGGLILLHVDRVLPGGYWLSGACLFTLSDAIVWGSLFAVAAKSAGGPPLTRNWLFKSGIIVQRFCVWLHFAAGLAEWHLVVVVVSLAVLFISTFVLSSLEASFPNAAPWCSLRVRHRGGTDGREEQSAAWS